MYTLKGVLETGGVHGVFTEVELDEVLGFGKGDERFVLTADHVVGNVKGHEFGEESVEQNTDKRLALKLALWARRSPTFCEGTP